MSTDTQSAPADAAANLAEQARQDSGSWDSVMPGKADNFRRSFGRMIGLLKPYAPAFIIVSILGAIGVFLNVIAPRILGNATDIVFQGFVSMQLAGTFPADATQDQVVETLRSAGQDEYANVIAAMDGFQVGAGIDFDQLRWTVLAVLSIYVFGSLLTWVQGYVINIVMVRTMWRLRESVEDKIHRLPLSYFDRVQRGELISRVTNDIDNITQTMQQSLSTAVTNILTIVGVLAMMFSISWQLAIVALIALPLMGVIFGVIGPRSQKAFGTQWRKVGRLNARVEESFSGHALVRVYGREQDTREKFQEENEELYEAAFKAQFLSGMIMPGMQFIGSLTYVGIAVLGGLMVASGQLRLGSVQAFIQYSQQFTQPLSELGGMAAVVQSGTASAERVFDFLDQDEQEPDAEDAPAVVDGPGVIEFENVAFSYSPDKPLIRDLSFRVEPGQTVAIVGPTGAGKTTLVNLLMRFYELDSGRILLDGQDISELTRHDVRERTGMVLQDPWLFAGSIRDNIRYGNEEATDAEIEEAAIATRVDRFVHSLPDGYETILDEDAANVSAGEKQLLTIARAFVSAPAVLILDEATSSVDTRTELLLQQAMSALREGRTSFVIAHRLSTIRDADLILVMEHGDIVEQGSHDDLIAREGAYFRLYRAQFEQAAVDDHVAEDAPAAPETGTIPTPAPGNVGTVPPGPGVADPGAVLAAASDPDASDPEVVEGDEPALCRQDIVTDAAPRTSTRTPRFIVTCIAIGLGAGLLSGMFGVGGGTVIVPLLILFLGFDQRLAAGTSLAAIVPTASVGVIAYALNGAVAWIPALILAAGAVIGAQIGTWLLAKLNQNVLRWAFIAFLVVVIVMLFIVVPSREATLTLGWGNGIGLAGLGLFTGVMAGLLGVGGGIIVVPALMFLFGTSDLQAKGTSLLMMIPTAISGTVGNVRRRNVDLVAAVCVGVAACATTALGAWLSTLMSPAVANILFATFMAFIAAQLAFRAVRASAAQRRTRRAETAADATAADAAVGDAATPTTPASGAEAPHDDPGSDPLTDPASDGDGSDPSPR